MQGSHSSVVHQTNTRPSLSLIFIFDLSVKTTFFQYVTVFLFTSLAHCILLFLFLSLINDFLRACLPLNPSECRRLRVFDSLTVLIVSLHFLLKSFAAAFLSSFTSLCSCLQARGVVLKGLPQRLAIWTFLRSRDVIRMIVMVPLGYLVSGGIFVICSSCFCHTRSKSSLFFFHVFSFTYFLIALPHNYRLFAMSI